MQIAAFDDPLRARVLVDELKQKGLTAYLVGPPPNNPNAPYRVRVGQYATRTDAEKAVAAILGKAVGGKLWVTRESQN